MRAKVLLELFETTFSGCDDVVDEGFWVFYDELNGFFGFAEDFVKVFSRDTRNL